MAKHRIKNDLLTYLVRPTSSLGDTPDGNKPWPKLPGSAISVLQANQRKGNAGIYDMKRPPAVSVAEVGVGEMIGRRVNGTVSKGSLRYSKDVPASPTDRDLK
jgi:hypothetical protein